MQKQQDRNRFPSFESYAYVPSRGPIKSIIVQYWRQHQAFYTWHMYNLGATKISADLTFKRAKFIVTKQGKRFVNQWKAVSQILTEIGQCISWAFTRNQATQTSLVEEVAARPNVKASEWASDNCCSERPQIQACFDKPGRLIPRVTPDKAHAVFGLNKPLKKKDPGTPAIREQISAAFRGPGVGSKLLKAAESRYPTKQQQIDALQKMLAPEFCYPSQNVRTLVTKEVTNMLEHVRLGCTENCFYVGSQPDDALHRAQNQAGIKGNRGVVLGEALLGLFLHGYNVRQLEKHQKRNKKEPSGVDFAFICPHLLEDPLATPEDCWALDVDLKSLRAPAGVVFGIVPNVDIAPSEGTGNMLLAAEEAEEYADYTRQQEVTDALHPADLVPDVPDTVVQVPRNKRPLEPREPPHMGSIPRGAINADVNFSFLTYPNRSHFSKSTLWDHF